MATFRTREELATALANDQEFLELPEADQDALFDSMAAELGFTAQAQAPLTREAQTEAAIAERPRLLPLAAAANAAKFFPNPAGVAQQMLAPGLSALKAAPEAGLQLGALNQTAEAAVAAPALALQRGQPGQVLPDTIKALLGQRPAEIGDVYRNAGVPGPIAATLGLATVGVGQEALTGALSGTARMAIHRWQPRSVAEVLQTPEAKLPKLTQRERAAYFGGRARQIRQQTAATRLQLKAEREALGKELGKAAAERSLELRPQVPGYLARQSAHYRQLADAELAPVANEVVETSKLAAYVQKRFGKDPEALSEVSSRLGLTNEALERTTTSPLLDDLGRPIQETVPTTRRIGELYVQAKEMGQQLPSSVRESLRVYTRDEHFIDEAIDALTGFLKEQGLNLQEANTFWRTWSPVRNQLVRETRPYNLAGTQTATFSKRLIRTAMGLDPDNAQYVKIITEGLGLKEGDLIGPLKGTVAKLDSVQKRTLALNLQEAEQIGALGDLRFRVGQITDRQQQQLAVIKWLSAILGGLGGIGVAGAQIGRALSGRQ